GSRRDDVFLLATAHHRNHAFGVSRDLRKGRVVLILHRSGRISTGQITRSRPLNAALDLDIERRGSSAGSSSLHPNVAAGVEVRNVEIRRAEGRGLRRGRKEDKGSRSDHY